MMELADLRARPTWRTAKNAIATALLAAAVVVVAIPLLAVIYALVEHGAHVAFASFPDFFTREVPVIMLTARAGEEDKIAGLEAGVDDYVTKPFSPRELEARIQAVLRRRRPQLSRESIEIEGLALNPATRTVTGGKRTLKMGPTEFELLHFFMTHTDRVYSRAQILDMVWGDHVFLEDRTVDVHIRRLREALAPSGHDRLVDTVRGAGYRFKSGL